MSKHDKSKNRDSGTSEKKANFQHQYQEIQRGNKKTQTSQGSNNRTRRQTKRTGSNKPPKPNNKLQKNKKNSRRDKQGPKNPGTVVKKESESIKPCRGKRTGESLEKNVHEKCLNGPPADFVAKKEGSFRKWVEIVVRKAKTQKATRAKRVHATDTCRDGKKRGEQEGGISERRFMNELQWKRARDHCPWEKTLKSLKLARVPGREGVWRWAAQRMAPRLLRTIRQKEPDTKKANCFRKRE